MLTNHGKNSWQTIKQSRRTDAKKLRALLANFVKLKAVENEI
jgi:hypothetical protein